MLHWHTNEVYRVSKLWASDLLSPQSIASDNHFKFVFEGTLGID